MAHELQVLDNLVRSGLSGQKIETNSYKCPFWRGGGGGGGRCSGCEPKVQTYVGIICDCQRLETPGQRTAGPKVLRGPPSMGQQRSESNVLTTAQGLQSDAPRMSTICEGCPQQPFRQLGTSGLAPGDL